jgi:hypothetical protein
MLGMTKRVRMKPADIDANNRRSVWPLIIAGAAVVATLSWMDPDGTSSTAAEWMRMMHSLAQQGLAIIRENLHQI